MRVLIIDKSKVIQQRLTRLFSDLQNPSVIACAEEPEQALNYIRELKPDVIIADVEFPGPDNLELLASIRKVAPGSFIIGLTSTSLSNHLNKFLEAGVKYVLNKVTDLEKLVDIIGNLENQ